MKRVFIFLGPSLPVATASDLLQGVTYLPPVQQGDILRLIGQGADIIGIIDGYFEVVPAVWHKEILLALEAGILVFGAASMGALRAAELYPFGMIGVGQIFEWLRDELIVRDDEVAIIHAPAELDYQPLSTALVDIRDACEAALRERIVTAETARALVAAAEVMPFPERSYEAVAGALGPGAHAREVECWLRFCRGNVTGLKARDAMALLRAVQSAIKEPPKPVPFGNAERTSFLNDLSMEVALTRFGGPGTGTCMERARLELLLRLLARDAAQRFGWHLHSDEVSELGTRLCNQMGVEGPDAWRQWMQAQSLSEENFWRYVNDSLLVGKLARLFEVEINSEIVDHLKMSAAKAP